MSELSRARGSMGVNNESLLIDMDGVMADTMGGAFKYIGERYNYTLAYEDIKDYWFAHQTEEQKTHIFEALRSRKFYRNLTLIAGVVPAVTQLREEYNGNVYVCSAPMSGAEWSETEKRDWLAEHFDEDFAREAIITTDKAQVQGRVIVEDNPHITGGIWTPVMFDQPYNRHITQYSRMAGWHDLSPIRENMRPKLQG